MSAALSQFDLGAVYGAELQMTPAVIARFREISGDSNPVHHDKEYAVANGFREPIAFGNLLGVLISRLVGIGLPTEKVIILKESIEFRSPVYAGDKVTVRATVAAVHAAVTSVQLKLDFTVDDAQVATGTCLIKCL